MVNFHPVFVNYHKTAGNVTEMPAYYSAVYGIFIYITTYGRG